MKKPELDPVLVASYLGKDLLIGITYIDENDKLIEQKQFHGPIVRINSHEGVVIRLHESEEEYKLPPDLTRIQEAPPGEYRLYATGEVVIDPDLLTQWTSQKAA